MAARCDLLLSGTIYCSNTTGIGGRIWKVIKDLYTKVKAEVLYAGSLSGKIDVSKGTGPCRILAPFMYKVFGKWPLMCAN